MSLAPRVLQGFEFLALALESQLLHSCSTFLCGLAASALRISIERALSTINRVYPLIIEGYPGTQRLPLLSNQIDCIFDRFNPQ
jgi:hypothetical protein